MHLFLFSSRHETRKQLKKTKKNKLLWHPTEMGTHESRCLSSACTPRQRETPINKQGEEEYKTPLQTTGGSKESPTHISPEDSNPVCKPILDFAQKMAEEIISQALLLCWEK